jgi:hypothetical protein
MENKKLVSVLVHDLKELEELLSDIKNKKAINLLELEFIQAKAAGVRQLLEIYSDLNPAWGKKVVPIVGNKSASAQVLTPQPADFEFGGIEESDDDMDDLTRIADQEPLGEIISEQKEEASIVEPDFFAPSFDKIEESEEEIMEEEEPMPEFTFSEPENPITYIESIPDVEPEVEWVIDDKPMPEDIIDSPEDDEEDIGGTVDEVEDDFEKIEEEEPELQEEEFIMGEEEMDEINEESEPEEEIVEEAEPDRETIIEEDIEEEPQPEEVVVQEKEPEEEPESSMDVKFHEPYEPETEAQVLGEKFQKERSVNDVKFEGGVKLEEKLSSMPLKTIRSAIGINDRFLFTRELFDGDPEMFNTAVTKLDSLEDIKDAVVYLRDNFKWKKNETSLKFVELVKRRFSNE